MRVFNLTEELEKERKKSKILEENNKLLIQQKAKMYEDLDKLSNRIDKTINILEKRINKIENQEWKSYTGQTDEEYLQEQKELLNILKGSDNNDK